MKQLCIFGAGGFAKEVFWLAHQCNEKVAAFIDLQFDKECCGIRIEPESFFNPNKHQAVVAVGNPQLRRKIAQRISDQYGESVFKTLIAPSANLMSKDINIGCGSVICANCILTGDIVLGKHSQLNLATTIGHDVRTGDFFTTAPGVHISGKVFTEACVYFGTNSSSIEETKICENVVVGAGACITRDIKEPGTYVGIPAKKLEKRQ